MLLLFASGQKPDRRRQSHPLCLHEWLSWKPTCPLCRSAEIYVKQRSQCLLSQQVMQPGAPAQGSPSPTIPTQGTDLWNQVLMIIKGLFRRYQRWNLVHPTSGAFWGMGIGIGCGVGWGPGFGPEVIGYVGAGCGVGFNVGITLAGIGIGLPANYLFKVPYNAVMATRSGALELARSSDLLPMKDVGGDGWNNITPLVSSLQLEASRRFSSFQENHFSSKEVDPIESKSMPLIRSIRENVGAFGSSFFHPHKD